MGQKRKAGSLKRDQSGDNKRKLVPQKAQLSGPGILLTTIRQKERKAGLELIEFLQDIVEELYPNLDLSIEEDLISSRVDDDGNDDDDLDALINGEPSGKQTKEVKTSSLNSTVKIDVAAENPKDTDIDAQIQAELDELRPKKGGGNNNQGSHIEKETINLQKRKKFTLIDPQVECLMFVSVAWPMDPVKLSCALLDRIAKTGQVRGHFIQRLSPLYLTARAESDKIVQLANTVMKKHFPQSIEPVTYKVDARSRLHTQLNKMEVIRDIAMAVPTPHRVNLTNPDYLINVEILKMTIGIGILPRFEEYKRYNLQMIAQSYNEKNSGKTEGPTSRTLLASASVDL